MIINLIPIKAPIALGFSIKNPKTISGVIYKIGIPARANVHLHERISGLIVASTLSNTNGFYGFTNISGEHKFFVTSQDPDLKYNAVIQDNVVPK
ncbi:carboxypeptidase regulatory-like domain-containing protein [Acinetobacter radioresistens]|uniref:carboxypeptidase regulatory-like domain-containing protein n=1 Tax=Acinetobacter radioresistens TaxID=40216 RepID=UPI0020053CC5|nr:carboxypeptidase regulatory-like domain-containing protein [Acinetobacter radioresistens]MCK4090250.1 carboxypeptidase regulatory-like domain-containing protein [Acinetobacter radioresistens]